MENIPSYIIPETEMTLSRINFIFKEGYIEGIKRCIPDFPPENISDYSTDLFKQLSIFYNSTSYIETRNLIYTSLPDELKPVIFPNNNSVNITELTKLILELCIEHIESDIQKFVRSKLNTNTPPETPPYIHKGNNTIN